MTTQNLALYRALLDLGVSEPQAQTASAFVDESQLATKSDIQSLELAIAKLDASLAWKVIGAMVALAGLFSGIVAILLRGLR